MAARGKKGLFRLEPPARGRLGGRGKDRQDSSNEKPTVQRAAPRSLTSSGKSENCAVKGSPDPLGEAGERLKRETAGSCPALPEPVKELADDPWPLHRPPLAPDRTYLPHRPDCAAALSAPAAGRSRGPPPSPPPAWRRQTAGRSFPPSRQPTRLSRVPGAI